MSLVYEKAVVVIGAGASVPFGAPDGVKLLDKIEVTLKQSQQCAPRLGCSPLLDCTVFWLHS
jgi:hypothetical protein